MRIYILRKIKESNETKIVATDRVSIFEKIIQYLDNNDKQIYLEIWEDGKNIGHHDINMVIFTGSITPTPEGCMVNKIIDNKLQNNFTANI